MYKNLLIVILLGKDAAHYRWIMNNFICMDRSNTKDYLLVLIVTGLES
jgi:hypothetical protein